MDATPDFPRRAREPMINLPPVVTALLALLVVVHAVREWLLTEVADLTLLLDLAFVPGRLVAALDPARAPAILSEALGPGGVPGGVPGGEDAMRAALAHYILDEPAAEPWTLASYALLHGSWSHVALNGVWFAAFGAPVARRVGAWRFLALGLVAVVAGALAHLALAPTSIAPVIGASAGVSGVMAAALRFVFRPPAPASTGRPPWQFEAGPPLQSVAELLRNRPAAVFLVIWIVTNVGFGLLARPLGLTEGAVAWDAHLGGFAAGFLLFPFFDRPAARRAG